ncbi:leishmanolysin-related zinc metalloendopeptidase [Salegentibacter sp. F188]|uniref:Leishmanolysin-related zinc metalloendopeptidase n=1 Tax=Autumnicola patrickiae TaxID=3075591 RepID=A0ABU3E1T8_9FLAO|nr:leishmanolysin-related zinc metalloendopeptidase [Salegentibacter sp. F188]MDT0689963.1 leishmanolysin-related zinc metalloendopeptidase [Salegentibacter sp. F188]
MKKFLKKSKLTGLFTAAMSAALLISCSEDAVDSVQSDMDTTAKQEFELLAPQDGMIRIDAKSNIAKSNISKKKATDAAGVDRGRFNISINYLVPVTDRQREVFESAAARWERIIIKDESSIPEEAVAGAIPSAFVGFPALNADGPVDDVVIEVVLVPIDGPGAVLGSAGPRFIRTSNGLTISGVMQFDTADLQFLDDLGLFENVIVHEMGHVLGVGTLWNVGDKMLSQGPASNPYFTGKKANVFWNAEGGEFELPIENIGGPGTAGGHWRESLLGNELMTGFINLGENPLSRITAGSMKDLGYGAASVGEQYDLAKGTPGVDISELDAMNANGSQGINIAEHEVLLQPIGEVVDK